MITTYTLEAYRLQLESALAWYSAHAYGKDFKYTDAERVELLEEIVELYKLIAEQETPR